MVSEYLLQKKEELIERKTQLESLLHSLNATIREDNKMAELLESESKPAFSDFSPRNNKNNAKVTELKDQIEENLEKASRLQIKMGDIDDRLEELDQIIREAKTLEKQINDLKTEQVRKTIIEPKENTFDSDLVIEEDSDGQMSFDRFTSDTKEKSESGAKNSTTMEISSDEENNQWKNEVVEKLENIQNYLPSDPFRTKIEILQLIKKLK